MVQSTVKLTLPKPNQEEKVYIPTMNEGNYAIATVDVHDTSGTRFEPYDHDMTRIEMLNAILTDPDIRNAGYEIASFDQLVYFWVHPNVNKRVTDSLRPNRGDGYRWLATITAAVGNKDNYRVGTADIRTVDERLGLMGLKEGKPHAQVAYAFGRVDEVSKRTQWKAVEGEQTEKISIPLFEYNFPGKLFVVTVFRSAGAYADWYSLSRLSGRGARLLIKLD